MMFDPPDYPYKELVDTYIPNNSLLSSEATKQENSNVSPSHGSLLVNNTEKQLLQLQSNDSKRHFSIENSIFSENTNINQNLGLFNSQSDVFFSSEPRLLDENTVNQFLLPLQESKELKVINMAPTRKNFLVNFN